MAAASKAGRAIAIRGAGTKADWSLSRRSREATKAEAPNIVSTIAMNRVLAHEHGDLTATIEAGATLRDVNAALARHGQWLPIDPAFADRATIGGILATNDSGPLRHRYGTPRDQVIGIRVVTTDGVIAKAGGQVVKNVAGYDLSRLITGSFGTLAAIATATFKLAPLPPASATLALDARDEQHVQEIVREVMSSQLEPATFEICFTGGVGHRFSGAVQLVFAGIQAAIDAQILGAQRLAPLKGCSTTADVALESDAIWKRPGAIMRASWLPAHIARVIAALKGLGSPKRDEREGGCATADTELVGRAAVGAGLIRIDGDEVSQAAAIETLEAAGAGNIIVLRGSDALKERWGVRSALPRVAAALKKAFDPAGILL